MEDGQGGSGRNRDRWRFREPPQPGQCADTRDRVEVRLATGGRFGADAGPQRRDGKRQSHKA